MPWSRRAYPDRYRGIMKRKNNIGPTDSFKDSVRTSRPFNLERTRELVLVSGSCRDEGYVEELLRRLRHAPVDQPSHGVPALELARPVIHAPLIEF